MPKASLARAQYQSALKLFQPQNPDGNPECSPARAVYSTGIPELWESILDYESLTRENGYFERRRSQQSRYWLYETLDNSLRNHFYQQPRIRTLIQEYEQSVLQKRISSFAAAQHCWTITSTICTQKPNEYESV
jgi:LAO/AO transport system kinase